MLRFLSLACLLALTSCHGLSATTGVGKTWGDGGRASSSSSSAGSYDDNLSSTNSLDGGDGDAISAWVSVTAQLTPSSVALVQSADERGFGFPSYEPMVFMSPEVLEAIERMDDPEPVPLAEQLDSLLHQVLGLKAAHELRVADLQAAYALQFQELEASIAALKDDAITWKGLLGIGTTSGAGGVGILMLLQRLTRRKDGQEAPVED